MAEYEGVTPESPAGTDQYDGASSAGTLNTETTAPRTETHVPYTRLKEAIDRSHEYSARAAAAEQRAQMLEQQGQQYQTRLQEVERLLRERAERPSGTPEEERIRQEAEKALSQLPGYARTSKYAQAVPLLARKLQEMEQRAAQQDARSAQSFVANEQSRLPALATEAGLTFATPEDAQAFERFVAGIIRSDQDALAAFQAGDPRVLPEAVKIAKTHYDAPARASRAALATTKAQTQRLPPRMGGSAPGAAVPALPKFDPADPGARERAFWKQLRSDAPDILARHA